MISVYSHDACLAHDLPQFPGLAPARLHAVRYELAKLDCIDWRAAEAIDPKQLQLVHTPEYIADILTPIAQGTARRFDADTWAVAGTADAALHSAGLVVQAVRDVMAGDASKAFCLVSPGGHHAEAEMAQGFCFFNHVALGATVLDSSRVAVMDFDAHHGNGTQSLFWNRQDRLLVDVHEETPRSGTPDETGAHGNILNLSLSHGSGSAAFRQVIETMALPKLREFKPDLLMISAGFDGHADDPLGTLGYQLDDYFWAGRQLARCADAVCGGRLVAVLEGGYNLDWLGLCAAAFVNGLTKI